ncbi:hypothetical protein TMEN_5401 [Trichophyton mentagrophytes]|nr:hypothetical protein TMEN_5401 [Trichophyton mentagrophytes]
MINLVEKYVRALVDLGAIGNFIDSRYIKELEIAIKEKEELYQLGGLSEEWGERALRRD